MNPSEATRHVWYERFCTPKTRAYGHMYSVDRPMQTLTSIGLGAGGTKKGDWYWCSNGEIDMRQATTIDKPPYRVPTMVEIAALPWNGLNVVSFFSGCGGSSLGYKMAGFRVLWANEFIPAAQEVYRLNHPLTLLDTRDIRQIQPQEVLDAIGLSAGDLDLMDGSPPCASFSTAGKREQGWGLVKNYCVDPATRVLLSDMTWRAAELLQEGDQVVAFDEKTEGKHRKFRCSTVLAADPVHLPSLRLTMTDGRQVTCSKEHRWLVLSGNNLRWKRADLLKEGDALLSFGKPWQTEMTRDAGWLAGIFDGEGHVNTHQLGVSQREGPVLQKVRDALLERGYDACNSTNKHDDVYTLYVNGGWAGRMRFLGEIRPERLVAKMPWEEVDIGVCQKVRVIRIQDVGTQDLIALSTEHKTFVAEGLLSHNSDTTQRVDDLFFEFARLLSGIQPKVFVAENVSGLIKGTAKGYFLQILQSLKDCGYHVQARLLDAQWLGVPQMRQRVIFIGVRNDLHTFYGLSPAYPDPLPYRYSVREALPWIVRQAIGKQDYLPADNIPARTVLQSDGGRDSSSFNQGLGYVEAETDITRYAIGAEWDKMKIGDEGKYFQLIKPDLEKPSPTIVQTAGITGAAGVTHPLERRKFSIAELKRICAFPDDFILTGTYSQQWERLGRAVPPVMAAAWARTIRDQILNRIPAKDVAL